MARIGIVADYHGSLGVIKAQEIAEEKNLDLMLQCGDHWTYKITGLRIPTLAVHGNHEEWGALEFGVHDVGLEFMTPWSTRTIEGTTFGFVGGIYKGGYNWANRLMMGVKDYDRWYNKPRTNEPIYYPFWVEDGDFNERPDIMITHDWPMPGNMDDPINPIREAVFKHEPWLLVHGHLHKYMDYQVGKTRVVGLNACDQYTKTTRYLIYDTKSRGLEYCEWTDKKEDL